MSDAVFKAIQGYKNATDASIKDNQNSHTAALTAGIKRNSVWECRFPIGDVTYPEFFNAKIDVLGATDSAMVDVNNNGTPDAGTDHTHTLSLAGDAFAQPTDWSMSYGLSRGGYITITDTIPVDTVGVISLRYTPTAVTNVYLDVFREDAAGGLSRVFSSDISADITELPSYIERAVSPPIVAQAGERYVVRVRNNNVADDLVGVFAARVLSYMSQIGFNTFVNPANTNQVGYTPSEAAAARVADDRQCIWALLAATNLADVDQTHSDDFNHPRLGWLWHLLSSGSDQLEITDNAVSYIGTTVGHQNGLYIRPTGSDQMLIQADLHDINDQLGLLMCCARDLSQVVYLGVTRTAATIYTGPYTSLAPRQSVSGVFTDSQWALLFDPASGTYTALLNGEDVGLSWLDSASAIQHGRDYRYGGLRIENSSGSTGNIDNWTLKDWV